MSTIAFIGLGNMGAPMVGNLIKAGHTVNAFDLSSAALEAVAKEGAVAAGSAVETLKGAKILITMLPAGVHVEGLLVSREALLDHLEADTLIIDCSTIDVPTAKFMAQEAGKKGFTFLDAPVSGGTGGAKAGTLSFIVGGAEEGFNRVKPILECMGQNIFHAGSSGTGQIAKACNNMMLAITMTGTAEALSLGIENGMDPKKLTEIMVKSSGNNWSVEKYNPVPGVLQGLPASNDYQGGFMVDLMAKDLGLAMELSQVGNSTVPMGSLAKSLYNIHQKNGAGKLDFSSIIKLFIGQS